MHYDIDSIMNMFAITGRVVTLRSRMVPLENGNCVVVGKIIRPSHNYPKALVAIIDNDGNTVAVDVCDIDSQYSSEFIDVDINRIDGTIICVGHECERNTDDGLIVYGYIAEYQFDLTGRKIYQRITTHPENPKGALCSLSRVSVSPGTRIAVAYGDVILSQIGQSNWLRVRLYNGELDGAHYELSTTIK